MSLFALEVLIKVSIQSVLGTNHNLSWGGGGGEEKLGAFNFFWIEFGGP